MSSAKDIAKGFTITGLLDGNTQTQRNYPVSEIELEALSDHPGNSVYSMDDASIERLAQSIKEQGLTDLPLVRRLDDGTYQMVSGHRRKAAYALLAKDDSAFGRMPCRIIEGVSDEETLMLLHAANYFTRSLSLTERAAATRALGIEVERRREKDASLKGTRTEDVKAAIIEEQTGRKVCGKTIKRQEALAELVETRLIDAWREKADSGLLAASCIEALAVESESSQVTLYDELPEEVVSKSAISKYVADALAESAEKEEELSHQRELAAALREKPHPHTDPRLKLALSTIKSYLSNPPEGTQQPDLKASSLLRCLSDHLPKPVSETQKDAKGSLRHA